MASIAKTIEAARVTVTATATVADLSDYEKIRAENIERNNARLRSLGLISAKEEEESNAIAWRKEPPKTTKKTTTTKKAAAIVSPTKSTTKNSSNDDDDDYEEEEDNDSTLNTARKRERPSGAPGSRKSLRLQGKSPSGEQNKAVKQHSVEKERRERVLECRKVRLARAVTDMEKAEIENPTASYGHCMMRVTSMSDKALANRVKSIERAAGKHCIVKMAIFKSCLQDEGKWELAELASKALERLKGLQPPPVEDE